MPAQFEIIYPDKTVAFAPAVLAGEPLYIGRDAAGVMRLSPDGSGELVAMLLESATGVVEVSPLAPDRVWLDGAPLHTTQRLAPYAEMQVDDHTVIAFSDGGPANRSAERDETHSATPAQGRPRVNVTDVRNIGNSDGVLTYAVTVQTIGRQTAYEPKVKLRAEVGSEKGQFVPLTEKQMRCVKPTFTHGETLNMQRSETRTVELVVTLDPSSLVLAGNYRLRVTPAFEHEAFDPDDAADALLNVPAFKRFVMGDPVPMRHIFPRYLGWPPAKSTVAITNEGNVVTRFNIQTENAPNSDCRASLVLLPRGYVSRSFFVTLRDRLRQLTTTTAPEFPVAAPQAQLPAPALTDTRDLEKSSQPQQMQGLDIYPNEKRHVEVSLVAQGQPIASLRHAHHQVNVSVAAQGVSPINKSIRLVTVPLLLGPLRVLLLLVAMALAVKGHVEAMNSYTALRVGQVCPTAPVALDDSSHTVALQEPVAFTVCGVPFTEVKLEKLVYNATPEVSAITEVSKTISFLADRSVSYRLTATHPLGRLLPWPPFVVRRSLDFGMRDDRAPDGMFDVQPRNVPAGGEVVAYWDNVNQAARLTLYANGVPNVIPAESIPAGQMKFTLTRPTTFRLEAVSDSGNRTWLVNTQIVKIDEPQITPTPLPVPVITRFDVSPSQVVSGQPVLLQWEVAGPPDAITVTLVTNGVPAIVPASAAIYQIPQGDASGMRFYALIADNGQVAVTFVRQVQVLLPTPVPTPTPGPVGKPNYDFACGGVGRADLRQLGEHWVWVCRDNPLADISNKVCRDQYGDKAYARAENEGLKETWVCWR